MPLCPHRSCCTVVLDPRLRAPLGLHLGLLGGRRSIKLCRLGLEGTGVALRPVQRLPHLHPEEGEGKGAGAGLEQLPRLRPCVRAASVERL